MQSPPLPHLPVNGGVGAHFGSSCPSLSHSTVQKKPFFPPLFCSLQIPLLHSMLLSLSFEQGDPFGFSVPESPPSSLAASPWLVASTWLPASLAGALGSSAEFE